MQQQTTTNQKQTTNNTTNNTTQTTQKTKRHTIKTMVCGGGHSVSPYCGCWRPPDGGRAGPPIGFLFRFWEPLKNCGPRRVGALRYLLAEEHRGSSATTSTGRCRQVPARGGSPWPGPVVVLRLSSGATEARGGAGDPIAASGLRVACAGQGPLPILRVGKGGGPPRFSGAMGAGMPSGPKLDPKAMHGQSSRGASEGGGAPPPWPFALVRSW